MSLEILTDDKCHTSFNIYSNTTKHYEDIYLQKPQKLFCTFINNCKLSMIFHMIYLRYVSYPEIKLNRTWRFFLLNLRFCGKRKSWKKTLRRFITFWDYLSYFMFCAESQFSDFIQYKMEKTYMYKYNVLIYQIRRNTKYTN